MTQHFSIPGKVHGKKRPRFSRRGKFVQTRSADEDISYEAKVAWLYKKECGYFFETGALAVTIAVYVAIPKSMPKYKKEQALDNVIFPTRKPDLDNIVKSICDSLNQVAYTDDKQIVDIAVKKFYTDENQRVDVIIERVGDEP